MTIHAKNIPSDRGARRRLPRLPHLPHLLLLLTPHAKRPRVRMSPQPRGKPGGKACPLLVLDPAPLRPQCLCSILLNSVWELQDRTSLSAPNAQLRLHGVPTGLPLPGPEAGRDFPVLQYPIIPLRKNLSSRMQIWRRIKDLTMLSLHDRWTTHRLHSAGSWISWLMLFSAQTLLCEPLDPSNVMLLSAVHVVTTMASRGRETGTKFVCTL